MDNREQLLKSVELCAAACAGEDTSLWHDAHGCEWDEAQGLWLTADHEECEEVFDLSGLLSLFAEEGTDYEYFATSRLEYRGVEATWSSGGPGIYVNTLEGVVRGVWGGVSEIRVPLDDRLGLDDYFSDLYASALVERAAAMQESRF